MSLQPAPNSLVPGGNFEVALGELQREISNCTRIPELKTLRDKAESVRIYAVSVHGSQSSFGIAGL